MALPGAPHGRRARPRAVARVLTRAFAVSVVQVQSAFVVWVVLVASILRSADCGGEAATRGVARPARTMRPPARRRKSANACVCRACGAGPVRVCALGGVGFVDLALRRLRR